MNAADAIAKIWYKHPVKVTMPGVRTAMGVQPGETVEVMASVNAEGRTVVAENGEEVVAAATLFWRVGDILPPLGSTITLPPEFGLKPGRVVVTARRVTSGAGFTPDHVEVTIK